jgi:hypothetical protein
MSLQLYILEGGRGTGITDNKRKKKELIVRVLRPIFAARGGIARELLSVIRRWRYKAPAECDTAPTMLRMSEIYTVAAMVKGAYHP